jgi:hypothetical protein
MLPRPESTTKTRWVGPQRAGPSAASTGSPEASAAPPGGGRCVGPPVRASHPAERRLHVIGGAACSRLVGSPPQPGLGGVPDGGALPLLFLSRSYTSLQTEHSEHTLCLDRLVAAAGPQARQGDGDAADLSRCGRDARADVGADVRGHGVGEVGEEGGQGACVCECASV